MTRYKVLPHPSWFKSALKTGEVAACFDPWPSVFNRDGMYFDRKTDLVWIEYDGKGYIHKPGWGHNFKDDMAREVIQFKYNLKHDLWHQEVRSFTEEEADAIQFLLRRKVLRRDNPLAQEYAVFATSMYLEDLSRGIERTAREPRSNISRVSNPRMRWRRFLKAREEAAALGSSEAESE